MNILVIGNGFDLAHELPTSYADVLNFLYAINITSTYAGSKKEYEETHLRDKNFNNSVYEYIMKAFDSTQKNCDGKYRNSNPIVQEIYNNLDCNIWFTYLWGIFSGNKMKGINWIDFESEISHIIEQIDSFLYNIKHSEA